MANQAAIIKLLIREVASLSIRQKSLERAMRERNPMAPAYEIKMDEQTQAMFDRLMNELDAKVDTVSASEPEDFEMKPGEKEPTREETRKLINSGALTTPAKAKPAKMEAKPVAKPKRKLADLSMDELTAKVNKMGGNTARILKGKVGRARPVALRNWIIAERRKAKA